MRVSLFLTLLLSLVVAGCEYDLAPDVTAALAGEACDDEIPCADTLLCVDDVCVVPAGDGCDEEQPCEAGRACEDGVCVGLPGATCDAETPCADGATCDDGVCHGGRGDACSPSEPCASSLACDDGTCLGGVGATCEAPQECAAPLECAEGMCVEPAACADDHGGCHEHATCADVDGEPVCTCNEGFDGDGEDCADIDECADATPCHEEATCTNTEGGYTCACDDGWSGDGHTCADVDECASEDDDCPAEATCVNNDGGFTCACPEGYRYEGDACVNIDECAEEADDCAADHDCVDTEGGFHCEARAPLRAESAQLTVDQHHLPGQCESIVFTNHGADALSLEWPVLDSDDYVLCYEEETCSGTLDSGDTCVVRVRGNADTVGASLVGALTVEVQGGIDAHVELTGTFALPPGAVLGWGDNRHGQVTPNGTDYNQAPVSAAVGIADLVSISAGGDHSCGVTSDGTGVCWGSNALGQLGDDSLDSGYGDTSNQVGQIEGISFAHISAGTFATCGVATDGSAWCWGYADDGMLGSGEGFCGSDRTQSDTPVAVLAPDVTWAMVDTGQFHACGVDTDGELYCWGRNRTGAQGAGSTNSSACNLAPNKITPDDERFEKVDAVGELTCALSQKGEVWCWGRNNEGAVGNGSTNTTGVGSPHRVTSMTDRVFVDVAASLTVACALDTEGQTWCWGTNNYRQLLTTGTDALYTAPVRLTALDDFPFDRLVAGDRAFCGLTAAGTAVCWGDDNTNATAVGRLGNGPDGSSDAGPDAATTPPPPVVGGHAFEHIVLGSGQGLGILATP